MESVSTFKNIFHALKKDILDKSAKNIELQTEVNEVKREIQAYRDTRATTLVAPSIDMLKTPETRTSDTQQPSSDRKKKSYTDVADREHNKKFKVTIRSKGNHTSESTKELIKTKINPTGRKVGISTFKALKDGRILIEVGSKEEIERISSSSITEKYGKELEAKVQELRNLRLVIYNIP